MSWTTSLAHGLAEGLSSVGIAVYRPTGIYRDDEVGIVVGIVPAAPTSVLVLTPYPLADDVDQADSVLGLQVRARAAGPDPRPALELLDAVFDELHGATHLNLGGALVHLAQRTASVPLSRDQNGRYEHADTYQLTAHRPTRYRS
ncbi:minor capsid protein [Actinokineospora sp. G85]|uniref:minor capsid protein n=1 Tax=Actinokineospora sp. G85 TaxID=3406626 RepID=UPI003C7083BB